MSESRRFVVAYDASDDDLRSRIRSLCRRYGAHRQFSLFEVRFTETEKAEFVKDARDLVSEGDGQAEICIYSVGPVKNDVVIPDREMDDEPANIV
ncbi:MULTISPECIES: CRISPR-associated endonuclease Cas2 [Salinibaculum]|uniref:CRISPR-associated endonuclease Cas2 n=1 Tax=Salinibaculum TaxID=2732368 RepID=UPI0030CD2734